MRQIPRRTLIAVVVPVLFAACDAASPVASEDGTQLVLRLEGTPTSALVTPVEAISASANGSALVLEGTNGTLELTGVWMVARKFKLHGQGGTRDFEMGPFFTRLPLDHTQVAVTTADVPPGRYDDLELRVREVDDDEPADFALLAAIREQIPDWPRKASIMVTGSFTSTGGEPREFRSMFEAEVRIRFRMVPELVVSRNGGTHVLTVEVAPALWFARSDGQVEDLSRFDFDTTRRLAEFRVRIRDGVDRVRFDD